MTEPWIISMGKASVHQTELEISTTVSGFCTAPARQEARSEACPSTCSARLRRRPTRR